MIDSRTLGGGGGGQFVAEKFSGQLQHALRSASPLTIAPPAGKKLRLDNLQPASDIIDVSIIAGSLSIVDNLTLSSGTGTGSFKVSSNGATNAIDYILTLEADDTITISTTTVAAIVINYSYSWGE